MTETITTTLEHQNERLNPLISFRKGGYGNNEHIKTTPLQKVDEHIKFFRVDITADTSYEDGRGSQEGPWIVYSNKLFTYEPDVTIDNSVLTSFFTTDVTSNTRNMYSRITVYYTIKDGEHKALLVEFVRVYRTGSTTGRDGTKSYIRREDRMGTKWAVVSARDIGITDSKVTAERLNKIRIYAGIGATIIHIETNKTGPYTYESFEISVTEENPWDPLSKVFKKYTHSIRYPEGGGARYGLSQYTVMAVEPSGSQFKYDTFSKNVKHVELFFKADANVARDCPLVVRFVIESDDDYSGDRKCTTTSSSSSSSSSSSRLYNKWSTLKNKGFNSAGYLDYEAVSRKDLVTVLLELMGAGGDRQNKLVIRLDERPDGGGGSTYPESGYNKHKIRVKKQKVMDGAMGVTRFDKYEHTFASGVTVRGTEGFYVSFERDSRYFMTSLQSESSSVQAYLDKVAVYYDSTTGAGSTKPLLFVFHFRWSDIYSGASASEKGEYDYPFSTFIEELESLSGGINRIGEPKIISSLTHTGEGRSDSALLDTLKEVCGCSSISCDCIAAIVGKDLSSIAGIGGVGAGIYAIGAGLGYTAYNSLGTVSFFLGI